MLCDVGGGEEGDSDSGKWEVSRVTTTLLTEVVAYQETESLGGTPVGCPRFHLLLKDNGIWASVVPFSRIDSIYAARISTQVLKFLWGPKIEFSIPFHFVG